MSFFKLMWKPSSKHEKLSEELVLKKNKETKQENSLPSILNENDAATFKLKFLGSTIVETISDKNVNSEAIKKIIKAAKDKKKKTLQTVNLTVSPKGITATNPQGEDILKVSVYRISNCSTDISKQQIFSFISTDSNEIATCHAFLCSKRKIAQSVTLAVASAFSIAYQTWNYMSLPNQNDVSAVEQLKENEKNNINQIEKSEMPNEERLIDFDSEPLVETDLFTINNKTFVDTAKRDWVSFEDDFYMDNHFQK